MDLIRASSWVMLRNVCFKRLSGVFQHLFDLGLVLRRGRHHASARSPAAPNDHPLLLTSGGLKVMETLCWPASDRWRGAQPPTDWLKRSGSLGVWLALGPPPCRRGWSRESCGPTWTTHHTPTLGEGGQSAEQLQQQTDQRLQLQGCLSLIRSGWNYSFIWTQSAHTSFLEIRI